MNEQMTIFEELSYDADPVYQLIAALGASETTCIAGIEIKRERFYICQNDDFQEGFSSLKSCYDFILGKIKTMN